VSLVRDAIGRGLPNLTVTWSWNYAGTIVRTRGIADATGRARSSQAITTTTPLTPIRVTATVQSGSVTYTSGTSFRRAP
jgi:hypothetical protein